MAYFAYKENAWPPWLLSARSRHKPTAALALFVPIALYLFCTDGLCGMMEAIQAVYPKSRLQRCIVHRIRSSTRLRTRSQFWHLVCQRFVMR